jgi:aquaporin Z
MENSQKYLAELIGTALVIFVGTAALVTTGGNPLLTALAFGLAWAGMWWVFGNVSGGHFNPMITIANVVAKRTNSKDLVPYVLCQVIGGIVGSVLLWIVVRGLPGTAFTVPALAATLAAPSLAAGWTNVSVLILELLLSVVLCLVWLASTEKTGATGITGLGIGLAYAGTILGSITVTWSALNPARTLGPAVLASTGFGGIWVFWVAPIVGAIVAAGIWMAVVQPSRTTAPSSYTAEA